MCFFHWKYIPRSWWISRLSLYNYHYTVDRSSRLILLVTQINDFSGMNTSCSAILEAPLTLTLAAFVWVTLTSWTRTNLTLAEAWKGTCMLFPLLLFCPHHANIPRLPLVDETYGIEPNPPNFPSLTLWRARERTCLDVVASSIPIQIRRAMNQPIDPFRFWGFFVK